MYKRHFIFALMCLLSLVAGSQNLSAQSQLAQDAYAIFEGSCLICHGPDGAYRETLLIEHTALINGGTVVPGNPDASELYKRLLGSTENGAQMPLGQPPLPDQSIDTIRRWILDGAPDWAVTPTTDRRFIFTGEILDTIEEHLTSLEPFDRAFARYFTLTHLYNAGETSQILSEYQKALNKLVNSLSWESTIINPVPVDPQGTIFYIDLRHYQWDNNHGWTQLEEKYPYHISFEGPDEKELNNRLIRLQAEMQCKVPMVHVDWFVATASTPPLYHTLLRLPLTDRELEQILNIDVSGNLNNAPGIRVWRAGFNNSRVSVNNRVVERHTSQHGAYWKSYDFAGSVGKQNIFVHPLTFVQDGGEIIFNLPNGLQAYYIVNESGFRLNEAPIDIVSNPADSNPTVRNGISCFGCHTEGMKTFDDQVRTSIQNTVNPSYNKGQALRLYAGPQVTTSLIQADMSRYNEALELTGNSTTDIEPISRFHEAYHASVDATYAAAVLGMKTELLLDKVDSNAGLQTIISLVSNGKNGSISRDIWELNFQSIVSVLNYPPTIVDSPVRDPQDVSPGGIVHIPDPALRSAILRHLKKGDNYQITVEDMQKIPRRTLNIEGSMVEDLTGIQFSSNLERLWMGRSPISDWSPIANLTNLRSISMWHNKKLSDISPLRRLVNLQILVIHDNSVSDLSPLSELIKLNSLDIGKTPVKDLSPLSGLINLEYIRMDRVNLPMHPLSGLVNMKQIKIWHNDMSSTDWLANMKELRIVNIGDAENLNLSGFRNKLKLEELYLSENNIVDVTPLAGLPKLRRLSLRENAITDVTPLSKLPNLEWLDIRGNNISDVSPFDGLWEDIKILWYDNPAFLEAIPSLNYAISQTPIYSNDIFSIDIRVRNVLKLAGWQFDIAFDPAVLEAVDVSEGDFLKTDGGATFFQSGRIDNAAGKITGLKSALLSDSGASGTGTILQVKFEAKSAGETALALQNSKLGSSTGEIIPAGPLEIHITVEERLPTGDVNRDGDVDILDLILVAQQLGKSVPASSRVDVNRDGVVNILDLTLVAQGIGGAAAPTAQSTSAVIIEAWIADARLADDGSIAFQQGIANLENLLASLIPQETALHANYPNPFNPETWIPYQLAVPAEVTLTIYDMNGGVIRRLEVGHQAAGIYQSRNRALYWDGRNDHGEFVASGLYFYTLKAAEFAATRKMLIRK